MAESMAFSDFKLGEARPWQAVSRRIEYPGEIVFAEAWQPELGEIATDIHFRIVVLTRHQQTPPIADRRVALCLPARAIREEREAYGVGEKAWEASRYAAGRVVTRGRLLIDAREVFSVPDNRKSLQLIASALLSSAYPRLPIDTSALRKTLSPSAVGRVFDGFFGRGDNPEARSALRSFSVALGLARPDDPYRFDPQDCPLFPVLAQRLRRKGGSLPVLSLYRELASSYGLTWPLITLYLLCFVHYGKPAVELRLKPETPFYLRSGEVPAQGRLTADLIPQVWWRSGLEQAFDTLSYGEETSWNALLPYARHLCPELEPAANLEQVRAQEASLPGRLGELREALSQVEGGLGLLSPKLGKPAKSLLRALGRLSQVARSRNYLDFYSSVQEGYASPDAFGDDLALCQSLAQLRDIAGEVVAIKSYLDGVKLRETDRELDMDRISILEQLSLENLLSNLHLWSSLKALFDWFLSRYRAIYQAHHQRYHREAASLRLVLEDSRPEVDALRRLNCIVELGEPVGEELFAQYEWLLAELSPCPTPGDASIDEGPVCSRCHLVLTAEPPQGEVESFLYQLKQALREQHRRLSSEAIRHILARSGEKRIDQFVKVVQTSDLSPLVNVLDDELVDFLRRLLSEAHIEIGWRPALSQLAEKFPSLDESEVDAAAVEFARALREAFARAKREHPGKRVRLSFKEQSPER